MKHFILCIAVLMGVVVPASLREEESVCPRSKQSLLILDLKSGWWGGDGENFHQLVEGTLKKRCPDLFELEYRHTPHGTFSEIEIKEGILSTSGRRHVPLLFFNGVSIPKKARVFPEDWNKYQQIWVLSGGGVDSASMKIESAEFQDILTRLKAVHANIFIGTGFGNIYHANPVAKVLGLGEPFATDKVPDIFPMPFKIETKTWIERGKDFIDHPVFADLTKLPEVVNVGGYDVGSDWIKPEFLTEFGIMASKEQGKTVIAATCGCNGRKTFVDTGLQRIYTMAGDFPNTFEYLLRIILLLQG